MSGDLEDLDEECFPQLREIDINSCPNIKGSLHHLYFHQVSMWVCKRKPLHTTQPNPIQSSPR